jgi:hypothetical protein
MFERGHAVGLPCARAVDELDVGEEVQIDRVGQGGALIGREVLRVGRRVGGDR